MARNIYQISQEESKKIRKIYPGFKIIMTGVNKSKSNRKKYYIPEYVLFSECNDIISELKMYIEIYEMISRSDYGEICYQNLKRQLWKQQKFHNKSKKY